MDSSQYGNAVLVLSTFASSNKPFIVDYDGKYFSFVFQILILVVKEILTNTCTLNTAMIQLLILVVVQPCKTSSGTLVAILLTNARLNCNNICWILICFISGQQNCRMQVGASSRSWLWFCGWCMQHLQSTRSKSPSLLRSKQW